MDAQQSATAHQVISKPRTDCRLCDGDLSLVLDLGTPFLSNFVRDKDDRLPKAPLRLMRCGTCGLLQLGDTVNPDLLWRDRYWYRSGVNLTMKLALRDVAQNGLAFHEGGRWLDIGANDGTLLSCVPDSFSKVACEPCSDFQVNLEEHADHVLPMLFDEAAAAQAGPCNVISSCAMFYDVEDPHSFLRGITSCLTDDGVWINQLSETSQMLRSTAFDNICHEHRCYYDVPSLKELYAAHGLKIVGVQMNDVNGGSMRVLAQKNGIPVHEGVPFVTEAQTDAFVVRVERWKQLMESILLEGPANGKEVWCYGASTKGSVLLQYLDLHERFTMVADRNPQKHGLMMAGLWLPITDEKMLRQVRPPYVLVLPWAFKEEFLQREQELRDSGTAFIFPLPNVEFAL